MIELAPNHKSGLSIHNPVLLGGGVIGCAEYVLQTLRDAGCGAVVVGPITHAPGRGTASRRLVETTGGYLLETGLQNRGVRTTVQRFARTWKRLGVPVVAQIADSDVEYALRTTHRLADSGAVAALELLVRENATVEEVSRLVESLALECELPLLVKTPHASAAEIARAAVDAGASAIVVCLAPYGMHSASVLSGVPDSTGFGALAAGYPDSVSGRLHGPALFPLMMQKLAEIIREELSVPVVASGGIHNWNDASAALAAGAMAVEIDGVAWVEPGLPSEIVRAWYAASSATAA